MSSFLRTLLIILALPMIGYISFAAFATFLTAMIWGSVLVIISLGILSSIQKHRHFEFDDKKFDAKTHSEVLEKYVRQVKE